MDNRRLRSALLVVGGAVVVVLFVLVVIWPHAPLDLSVYVQAGRVFVHNGALYGPNFGRILGFPLPYTYPPPLAALMGPISYLPWWFVRITWTVVNLVLLVWIVRISYAPFLNRLERRASLGIVLLLTGVIALTIPVEDVIHLGQIDIIIVALVLADTVRRSERLPQGVLVGIATAIKLTPGAFVGYWLLIKRWRPALIASVTAVAVWAAAAILRPSLSIKYWTDIVFKPERIGDPAYLQNQAIGGFLHRAGLTHASEWFVCALLAMGVALWLARRAHLGGDELAAVTLVGLGTLLASPVSWPHHAIWIVPATGLILGEGRDRRRVVIWAAVPRDLPSPPARHGPEHRPVRDGRDAPDGRRDRERLPRYVHGADRPARGDRAA